MVGLVNPKSPLNVGSAMRACGVYGATQMVYTGDRYQNAKKFVTDPQEHHRRTPLTHVADLRQYVPLGCVPVAVEYIVAAKPLHSYKHPERAFYVFGPEDGSIGSDMLDFCRDVVYIPTNGCMNLAATVNVVLYDRRAKQMLASDAAAKNKPWRG